MTEAQKIEIDIMMLKAQLYGKRMELAILRGNSEAARKHKNKMFDAIRALHAARMSIAEQAGECFFVASGEADRLRRAVI